MATAEPDDDDEALYGGAAVGGEAGAGDVGLGGDAAVAEEAALEDEGAGGKGEEAGEGAGEDGGEDEDEDDGVDVIIDQEDLQTPGRPGGAGVWGGAALVSRCCCAARCLRRPLVPTFFARVQRVLLAADVRAPGSPTANTCAKVWKSSWESKRQPRRGRRALVTSRAPVPRFRTLSNLIFRQWKTSPGANLGPILVTGSTMASMRRHGKPTARSRWSCAVTP